MSLIRARRDDDRGAIALFVVVFTVALLAAVGLVVDGGGKVRALQRADEAAREAARAGSQMLDVPSAVRGDGLSIDPAAAARAARAYLDAAGVDGTVTVQGNDVRGLDEHHLPARLPRRCAGVGPLDCHRYRLRPTCHGRRRGGALMPGRRTAARPGRSRGAGVRALLALVVLLALCVGIPLALVALAPTSFPHGVPSPATCVVPDRSRRRHVSSWPR